MSIQITAIKTQELEMEFIKEKFTEDLTKKVGPQNGQ